MITALVTAGVALTMQGILAWYLATRFQRASIADIFWPLHHLLAGLVWLLLIPETVTLGATLAFTLLAFWAVRLATHLSVRQVGAPEDHRYTAVRDGRGDSFAQTSLYLIFIPQSLMALIMSLALIPALTVPEWSWLAFVGLAIALIGLAWQVAADLQLTAFLKHAQPTHVLSTGLWSLSRHPNYFGEWLFWLGFCVSAFSLMESLAVLAFLPMVLLTYLLMRFTGVQRTETGIENRRPDYHSYQRRTPAFFPKLPGSGMFKTPVGDLLMDTTRAGFRLLKQRFGWWSVLLCLGFGMNLGIHETAQASDQTANQQTWVFDVRIDGKDVGFHEFVTTQGPSGFDITARAKFRYRLLGVTLFSYDHEVREQYDSNMCLVTIESETKTNNTVLSLKGAATDNGYAMQTTEENEANIETVLDQACLMTFAYWSPKLLTRQQLLNGQTGQIVDVSIGPVTAADANQNPNQYFLKGDKMDITLGFGQGGQWRSLDSKLPNGRKLTYHLRRSPPMVATN